MALELELETFKKLKDELLKTHAGKFALIKGDSFVDAYDSPQNAYAAAVDKFGKEIFLIKRISETEEVYRNQSLYSGLVNARL